MLGTSSLTTLAAIPLVWSSRWPPAGRGGAPTSRQVAFSVDQEQSRHATAIVQLERGQRAVVDELKRLNERIDNVFTGPLGESKTG